MTKPISGKTLQIRSYLCMFLLSMGIVLSAEFLAYVSNTYYPLSKFWINLLEYLGYVCWGTALAESKVTTWCKVTSPEILHRRLQMILSMGGIFFFVSSKDLVPLGVL